MKRMVLLALLLGCSGATTMVEKPKGAKEMPGVEELRRRRAEFADVEITVDPSTIRPKDRAVLRELVKASAVMDRLFWKQACGGSQGVREEVAKVGGEAGRLLRELVEIHYGVHDRLRDDEPFFGTQKKPLGATFYPEDMTREEFEAHLRANPKDRELFESPFTVIRRDKEGRLVAIPYSEFYREDLEEAALHLRRAADLTDDKVLARFLRSRADAFLSNDYFESDLAWMDLGQGEDPSPIEVTIGPYEVYEDRLFNLKAAFEAFVTIRDKGESEKLAQVAKYLDEIEASLPIDDHLRNYSRGPSSPIAVVNVVYTAGDTRAGVQTTAFNLPNDERVRAAKGSKKVLLKNVGRAKFSMSLIPIAKRVLDEALLPLVDFEAYFNHVLMHEVSHGVGPGIITRPDGSKTTVNGALRETYSSIEECKADVVGMFATLHLIKKGVFPKELEDRAMATYLAGIFRSVRFGTEQAHGKANIIQYNYLREAKAFTYDGRFGIVRERFEGAIRDLAKALLTIEALGDYEGAKAFIARYGSVPEEVREALGRLEDVPVDIRPIYPLGEALLSE